MKNFILLLLIPFISFGQMIRSNSSYNGVNYLRWDPPKGVVAKGVILYLHGQGERGNDTNMSPSIIEHNEIPKQMATITVPYIVIVPQLPSTLGGWYENITQPMVEFIKTFPGHKHLTGISLGGMRVTIILYENPGVFNSASTVCGKNDVYGAAMAAGVIAELTRIPTIHYYDPADNTVAGGYASIKSVVDQLTGKADITLQTVIGGHAIWPVAYQQSNFWSWLNSKVSPPPAPILDPIVSEATDGVNIYFTTQSGKVITK